uniref:Uncharacterized protein n=1 Tax=Biomphalaria glabrata TaxID=6526 RepID=A0A2C9L3P3_BIOGL
MDWLLTSAATWLLISLCVTAYPLSGTEDAASAIFKETPNEKIKFNLDIFRLKRDAEDEGTNTLGEASSQKGEDSSESISPTEDEDKKDKTEEEKEKDKEDGNVSKSQGSTDNENDESNDSEEENVDDGSNPFKGTKNVRADTAQSGLNKAAPGKEENTNLTERSPAMLRAQRMTTKPSMQLIGIVVGVILSSVLLTGFIRWRVKKHLDGKKLRKLAKADKRASFKHLIEKQEGLMETIFECDETRGAPLPQQAVSRTRRRDGRNAAPTPRRPWLLWIICGEKSSESLKAPKRSRAPPRTRLQKHCVDEGWNFSVPQLHSSHRESYPRHDRPDHEHLNVTDPLLNPLTHSSLAPPPVAPIRRSPSPVRNVMESIKNTVFTFHRDWVGRRWLERHNLSISGILHGGGSQNQQNSTDEEIQRNSEEDMSISSERDSCSVASELQALDLSGSYPSFNIPLSRNSNTSVTTLDENANITSSFRNEILSRSAQEANTSQYPAYVINSSYIVQSVAPPSYCQSSRRPSTPVAIRNANRNQQRQSSSPSPVQNANSSRPDARDRSFTVPLTDLISEHSRIRLREIASHVRSNSQSDINMANSQYVLVTPLSGEFSQNSGVVLEQLSDGSKIIFVPSPFLPGYHNDNPPPYNFTIV